MKSTRRANSAATKVRFTRRRSVPNRAWVVVGVLLTIVALPARATLIPFGTEFQVNSGTAVLQTSPAVAMDPSGGSIVVWGSGGAIVGQRYDKAARALGGEFVANANGAAFHSKPSVATDARGGFVLVWQNFEPEPSDYVIRGQRYDADGAPVGGEFQVDSDATDRQYKPVVAVDPAGGFLVVWEGRNPPPNSDFSGVFARRYDASGEPLGEEFQINSVSTRFAASPAVATDSAGNLVVVWEGSGTGNGDAGIFGRRYDAAGEAVGSEFQISDPTDYVQFVPVVATDVTGGFVVVWQRAGFFISHVVGRRFDSGAVPIDGVFTVADEAAYTNSYPTVATFPSGNFLVVWERSDLSQIFFGPGDIMAQHYLPDGAADGGQIIVHRTRDGDQRSPAVSADASGNLVVVWHGLPGDGLEAGIYGRRYTASCVAQRTQCAGDCDGDHNVTINELVRSVKLLLDDAAHDTCPAADLDDNGAVTIAELVTAVNDAMNGCPLTAPNAS